MAPAFPVDFTGQKESKKCSFPQSMGKSRNFSKGHPSSCLPDYIHAVETIGESEGFGSSGRVDTEMTASDDSFASKRKCIRLNSDGYEGFGVPMQVISLTKMSRTERKDLELKLKKEIEQVRFLQRKVVSLGSTAVILSPSSDIQSCSEGQRRPAFDGFNRTSEVSVSHSKKRPPPSRNGIRPKKGKSSLVELVKPAAPAGTSNATIMKQCETLLNKLMSHQYGWVFNTPVDVVKLNIPDYFNVIKRPMDLGTVKRKLVSGEYPSPLIFAADVRLTFSNAMKYNPPGNDVHIMAETLNKMFEGRWKSIEKKLPSVVDIEPVIARDSVQTDASFVQTPKKRKPTPAESKMTPEPVKRVMTDEEKHKLSSELEASVGELPESIIEFLKQHSDQTDDDEIEIDIDSLSQDTLFRLRELLDDFLLEKCGNRGKAEPCEMEIHNESGFSNSSLPLQKGHDQVVGGDDPPVSILPSTEIDDEKANRTQKCSSPTSSSSESGSSSDSDSGSSSGSESDTVKPSGPVDATKEKKESGDALDEKNSGLGRSDIRDDSGPGLLSSQDKLNAVDVANSQDGESALPERQVSPDKLYRAALLRNRFADTIFKAREKALEKGEKQDPERLQLEREELERRQKEERARLQAEAKAAEEARKKAEAEAAAEAKRRREQEREAARQALQQMEKTVDMDENSHFMEHLALFGPGDDEQATNAMDVIGPELSQNGLGSFKLQGNPLEQLGLYMKNDDEEEEEIEPSETVSVPTKDAEKKDVETKDNETEDVEEGEID